MNLKEAKKAFEDGKMVQHKEDKNICNYISCFDDEETGGISKTFTHIYIIEKTSVI